MPFQNVPSHSSVTRKVWILKKIVLSVQSSDSEHEALNKSVLEGGPGKGFTDVSPPLGQFELLRKYGPISNQHNQEFDDVDIFFKI